MGIHLVAGANTSATLSAALLQRPTLKLLEHSNNFEIQEQHFIYAYLYFVKQHLTT